MILGPRYYFLRDCYIRHSLIDSILPNMHNSWPEDMFVVRQRRVETVHHSFLGLIILPFLVFWLEGVVDLLHLCHRNYRRDLAQLMLYLIEEIICELYERAFWVCLVHV